MSQWKAADLPQRAVDGSELLRLLTLRHVRHRVRSLWVLETEGKSYFRNHGRFKNTQKKYSSKLPPLQQTEKSHFLNKNLFLYSLQETLFFLF